jgi:NADH-quinone oxidoreductase subunit M
MTALTLLQAAASPSPSASISATPIPTPFTSLIPTTPIPSLVPITTPVSGPPLPTLLLSGIVWIPLIVALLLLLVPVRTERDRGRMRIGAIVATSFSLVLGLFMWYSFADQGGTFAYEEQRSWLPQLGASYHLGVDGVSMPLLLLSTVLFFTAVLASKRIRERAKEYFVLLLLVETAVNGVFASLDNVLLLLFWAMPVVPLSLLIAGWGGPGRARAAAKTVAFLLLSAGLLTVAVLVQATRTTPPTFDLGTLHLTVIREPASGLLFWLFFLSFAILLPVTPLHTWFTDAVAEAVPPVGALIGGALPVMGGYGLYRVVLGQYPTHLHAVRGAILALTLLSLLWSGVAALGQDDLNRAVAFLAQSRMSLVLLAVLSAQPVALNGGILLMFASGLGTALLILTVGMVVERTGTRSIRALGGLALRLPRAAILYLVGGLGVIGLPGLAGFGALVMLFLGAYPAQRTGTTIAILSTLLVVGLVVWTAERVFFGTMPESFARIRDIGTLELSYALTLIALIVLLGIFPALLINNINFGILSLLAGASG